MSRTRKDFESAGACSPIGDRLREERTRLGLTQAALGVAVQVHRNTVKRYECNETQPATAFLIRIEELGIDTTFVLTGQRRVSHRASHIPLGEHHSPEEIADDVLSRGDKRSAEYRRGFIDVLAFRLEGKRIQCPYQAGTLEFDAYFAGNERGHFQWRLMVESEWKPQ